MAKLDFSVLRRSSDADDLFSDFRTLVSIVCPEFQNPDLTDPGNAVGYVICAAIDYLNARADAEALQLLFEKVSRPASIRSLLRLFGQELTPPSAASADLLLTVVGALLSSDVPIPKYHPFQADETGVVYLTLSGSNKIPAMTRTATVPVTQGRYRKETIGVSDYSQNQILYTDITGILQNDLQKTINLTWDGVPWTAVTSFAASRPTDLHYIHQFNGDGTSRFILGDGSRGAIPANNAVCEIECIQHLGKEGNCDAGSIKTLMAPLTLGGSDVQVTVTNPEPASGGSAEQTIAEARRDGPSLFRSGGRLLNPEDYPPICRKFPGVLDAKAARTGLDVITVYVVAREAGGVPSETLLTGLQLYLQALATGTTVVLTAPAVSVAVDVTGTIKLSPRYLEENVIPAAEEVVETYFDLLTRMEAGETILGGPDVDDGHRYPSQLIALVEAVPGTNSMRLTRFTRVANPVLTTWTGNASFSSVPTPGTYAVAEEILVSFISSTAFRVTGSVSGSMGTGILDTTFTDEGGRVSFLLIAGTESMAYGDLASFRLSPVMDDVVLESDEVAVLGDLSLERAS